MIKKIGFTTIWFLMLNQVSTTTVIIFTTLMFFALTSTKELNKLSQFNTKKNELAILWFIKCSSYGATTQIIWRLINGIAKNIK